MDSLTFFGPYRVIKTLARGGMAEIFMAKKEGPAGFTKTVVVKRILPEHSTNEEFVQMFRDEARLAAQLEHPNIVHITDFGEVQGAYYLAMEHLQGQELGTLLRSRLKSGQGPLPPAIAAAIAAQACAGLHYAHTFADESGKPLRIVHRDISPSNLFLTYQGVVKVLDFGIAKAEGKLTQTRAGIVKGKLLYMSPEQTWAKVLDARSDVWALGVVLYEFLTGSRPFFRAGQDDARVMNERLTMMAIDQESPTRLTALNPAVPAALEDIVFRCMEKDPTARWQSAAELRRALETFLQTQAHSGSALVEFIEATVGVKHIRQLTQPTPAQSSVNGGPEELSKLDPLPLSIHHTRAAPQTVVGVHSRVDVGSGNDVRAQETSPRAPSAEAPAELVPRSSHRGLVFAVLGLVVIAGVAAALAWPSRVDGSEPINGIEPNEIAAVVDAGRVAVAEVAEVKPAEPTPEPSPTPTDVKESRDAGPVIAALRPLKTKQTISLTPPAPAPETKQPVGAGRFRIICPPWGEVYVDGLKQGMAAPSRTMELAAGPHEVECRHSALGSLKAKIMLEPGATLEKTLTY